MDPYVIKHVVIPQAIAAGVMTGAIFYAYYKAWKIDQSIAEGYRKMEEDEHRLKNWYHNLPLHTK